MGEGQCTCEGTAHTKKKYKKIVKDCFYKYYKFASLVGLSTRAKNYINFVQIINYLYTLCTMHYALQFFIKMRVLFFNMFKPTIVCVCCVFVFYAISANPLCSNNTDQLEKKNSKKKIRKKRQYFFFLFFFEFFAFTAPVVTISKNNNQRQTSEKKKNKKRTLLNLAHIIVAFVLFLILLIHDLPFVFLLALL